jgi:hypothetical protein
MAFAGERGCLLLIAGHPPGWDFCERETLPRRLYAASASGGQL